MAFSKVCVAVLAAGQSQRMGFPKLIEPFAGTTLLDRDLDAALGCAADVACVVTGAYHELMAPLLARRGATDLVLAPQGADRSWPGEGRDPRCSRPYGSLAGADARRCSCSWPTSPL